MADEPTSLALMASSTHNPLVRPQGRPARLPLEICESIIDLIDAFPESDPYGETNWERYRALHSLCLVCRDFHLKARTHLFRSVRLQLSWNTWQSSNPNVQRFYQSLTLNPSNGRLVLQLFVSTVHSKSDGLSLLAWSLPRRLPNLEHIYFSANLRYVHPKFFTGLAQFKTVKTLHMSHMRFATFRQLFRVISSFKNLDSLVLEREGTADLGDSPLLPPPQIPVIVGEGEGGLNSIWTVAIKKVNLETSPMMFGVVVRCFQPRTTHLKINIYRFRDAQVRELCEFVSRCGGCLEELSIRTELQRNTTIARHLDLSQNVKLRVLDIAFFTVRPDNSTQDITSISNVLSTITTPKLSHLAIQIYHWGEDVSSPTWEAVDFVTTSLVFDRCERIRVGMYRSVKADYYPVNEEVLKETFPRLAMRPVVDFAPFDERTLIIDMDSEYEDPQVLP